jgi:hypothetical protein
VYTRSVKDWYSLNGYRKAILDSEGAACVRKVSFPRLMPLSPYLAQSIVGGNGQLRARLGYMLQYRNGVVILVL